MSHVDDAVRLFGEGKSCSQALFAAFAPSLGMEVGDALRLASGFGGGMHVGGACGAATGAVLALGFSLCEADCETGEDRRAVMEAVQAFYTRFGQRVGAIDCPDILEFDVRTAEGRAEVKTRGLRESRCTPAVRAAAEIVEEILSVP